MKLKLISLVSGLFLAGAVWAQTVPNDFVEKLSNEVLTEVRNDKQMKQGDIGRISQLGDQKLMPHVCECLRHREGPEDPDAPLPWRGGSEGRGGAQPGGAARW